MAHTLPIARLIELAQSRTDDAARRLGPLQEAHGAAAGQLEMLLQYRQEYRDRLEAQMKDGVAVARMLNFQNFVGTLDSAIAQQRALTDQASMRLAKGRGDWQHCKRQLSAFDTLAERARQQQALALGKREQRDNDEHNSRQLYRQSSGA